MPTRDKVHDAVKQALINDGWTITHDPLQLPYGRNSELMSDSLQEYGIKLIVFSPRKEVIIQWIS